MAEKIYRTMRQVGIFNLVLGICFLVGALGIGIMMIINGARLLKKKSELLF